MVHVKQKQAKIEPFKRCPHWYANSRMSPLIHTHKHVCVCVCVCDCVCVCVTVCVMCSGRCCVATEAPGAGE